MDLKVKDLKIGAPLIMGRYGVKNENPFPILWLKCNPNCDFITQYAIDYICFDANEPNGEYRGYGNPIYSQSNILSFMNSVNENWYYQTHQFDGPPDLRNTSSRYQYKSHFGFLYHFEEYEIESLMQKVVEVGGTQVTAAVHLPSASEIFGENRFELFSRRGSRAKGTDDMIENRANAFDNSSFVPYWLRDRIGDQSRYARYFSRSSNVESATARNTCGLRPICAINPDTPVVIENGLFIIKPRNESRNAYTDEELFELLGLAQP